MIGLSACQVDRGEIKGVFIESSSVEFGSLQDPDDRALHFRVQISDYGNDPELEYKVRFLIQDPYISDLIGEGKIENNVPYKTQPLPNDGEVGMVIGSSREIIKEFDIDEIRKSIENEKAVIVELYHLDKTIDREEITIFKANIEPLVKINPNSRIENINLNETNKISIFRRVVSDSTKQQSISYIIQPKYTFKLDNESYFLWITEDEGYIMNIKDTFAIYKLSKSSLKEVKEVIQED